MQMPRPRRLIFRTLVESDRLLLNVQSHDDIVMEDCAAAHNQELSTMLSTIEWNV